MNTALNAVAAKFLNAVDTDDEKVAFEDILDAAAEWADGRLPLLEFEQVGEMPGDRGPRNRRRHLRFRAWFTAANDDPRKFDLMSAVNALVETEGLAS